MSQYEALPGYLYHRGKRFSCPCGVNEFRVEVGTEPKRFWCECGAMYTEYMVDAINEERQEVAESGE